MCYVIHGQLCCSSCSATRDKLSFSLHRICCGYRPRNLNLFRLSDVKYEMFPESWKRGNFRKRWFRWRQEIHNHLTRTSIFCVREYQFLKDTPVTLFYFILQWPVSNVTYEDTCKLMYFDCHQWSCWNQSSHCCCFANTWRNSVCVFRGLWVCWPGGDHAEGWPLFPSCWLPLQAALCTFNTFYVVISHTRPAALFRNAGDMFYDFRWNCWLCRERMTQVPLHLDVRNI